MKTLNFEKTREIFADYSLTNSEMINVKGGEGDPVTPPIKI
jgi:hypothetical protein